jgi:hypothetical protein
LLQQLLVKAIAYGNSCRDGRPSPATALSFILLTGDMKQVLHI